MKTQLVSPLPMGPPVLLPPAGSPPKWRGRGGGHIVNCGCSKYKYMCMCVFAVYPVCMIPQPQYFTTGAGCHDNVGTGKDLKFSPMSMRESTWPLCW